MNMLKGALQLSVYPQQIESIYMLLTWGSGAPVINSSGEEIRAAFSCNSSRDHVALQVVPVVLRVSRSYLT